MVDLSSEKYSGSTGHTGTPGTSRESFSEDAKDENFSAGTRNSCVQQNHCTSRMRSQLQLNNDQYVMMQYTNWINSTLSQQ